MVDHYDRAQRECVGIPGDANPLETLGVTATRPIASFTGRPRLRRTRGARIFVRGREGLTAGDLLRRSTCRIERMALLLPEQRAAHDPLAVDGVHAEVRPTDDGFELWVTTPRTDAGAEVYRRARLMASD